MSNINVAFFGTSDKSEPVLEALKKNFNLVLCITKNDTRTGRKKEIRETKVKSWAKTNDVPYVCVDNLKDKNLALVKAQLIEHKIDIGVVADYDIIIPSEIFSTLEHGLINIHFSLLPKYRGASPIQHTIINGDQVTGITFQQIDKGMDTGDIVFQVRYELKGNENTQNLYNTLFEIASMQVQKVISEYISGKLIPKKQDESAATYCYSPSHPKSTYIYKEDARISWEEPVDRIERKIRAYYPWPIAWTTLNDIENSGLFGVVRKNGDKDFRVKLHSARLNNGKLEIEKIQVESKNILGWEDFVNGYFIKN
jgi:methionyl-tRNA formyltransferase